MLALWSVTSTGVAALAGRLPARLDATQRLFAGLLVSGATLAGLAVLDPAGARWWAFAPGLFVAGLGTGLVNAALARTGQRRQQHRPLPRHRPRHQRHGRRHRQ